MIGRPGGASGTELAARRCRDATWTPAHTTGTPDSGGFPSGILDLGVFAGTFLFRWLTVDFTNDHFVHLSRARQILLGDVPIRDFFDAGFFLQLYLSSAAQLLFGDDLFGEAVLSISFIAFGTMLVFHLSAQLSGSRWIAGSTALLMLFAFPRLYSYPKIFLYVAAIGLAWLYARRGTRLHVCLMAALTTLAFLLRHDHGLYIGIMMVCFLGLHEWGGAQLWRRVGLYAGVTAGLVTPLPGLRPGNDRTRIVCRWIPRAISIDCLVPVVHSDSPRAFQDRSVGPSMGYRARIRGGRGAVDRGGRRRRTAGMRTPRSWTAERSRCSPACSPHRTHWPGSTG